MRFQIESTPEETRRSCAAIVQAALPPSRANYVVVLLYVAVGVVAYLLTPATRVATFLIGVAAVAATTLALQVEGRARVRRLQVNDPHASEPHFIEVSAEGVHSWCSHVDARYPWRDFAKVTENPEFFVLARASGVGSAVPKRLLAEKEEAELRAQLREWSPDHGAGLGQAAR